MTLEHYTNSAAVLVRREWPVIWKCLISELSCYSPNRSGAFFSILVSLKNELPLPIFANWFHILIYLPAFYALGLISPLNAQLYIINTPFIHS